MKTHLSLFTGIGGLDLAAEWAGFETVGQCEWADYPTKVLEKHWPDVDRWRDIHTLTGDDFFAKTGLRTVDLISGGFPCQPFSVAGKRRGKEDDRYLWKEMLRVVSQLKPSWVVGENVAGIVSMAEPIGKPYVESRCVNRIAGEDHFCCILSQQERMLLIEIITDLETLGYEVQTFIIPACGVGAPHRRDRVAIVAYSDSGTMRDDGDYIGEADGKIDTPGDTSISRGTDVAHPQSIRFQGEWSSGKQIVGARCKARKFKRRGNVRNATSERLSHRRNDPLGRCEPIQKSERSDWWATEPNVGRVAHGVPNRVDRLKSLGNAVVWQQFFPIFKAISEIMDSLTPRHNRG